MKVADLFEGSEDKAKLATLKRRLRELTTNYHNMGYTFSKAERELRVQAIKDEIAELEAKMFEDKWIAHSVSFHQDEHMKVSELLSEGEIGTLTISQEGDKLIVKCTQRSGILARFGVAHLARNIVKGKVRAFKMNFDKRIEVEDVRRLGEVSKLAFTGITKEKLQAEVDKTIEHFRKEEDAEEAYKAKAPERKAAKAKYDAQKRKDELAKYDELYGKGTWGRVTYMQREVQGR